MGPARTRSRRRIFSRAKNATGYSPSRAVMRCWPDLGDAKVRGITVQIFGSRLAAARSGQDIFLDHYFLTANTQTTPP
jgi:hypothetical protein